MRHELHERKQNARTKLGSEEGLFSLFLMARFDPWRYLCMSNEDEDVNSDKMATGLALKGSMEWEFHLCTVGWNTKTAPIMDI